MKIDPSGEGCYTCPLWKDWEEHKIQTRNIESKVTDVHAVVGQLLKDTGHLSKLDRLDSLELLVKAVTGMNKDAEKSAYMIGRIFGFVILGLTLIIVALLTGAHLDLLKLH